MGIDYLVGYDCEPKQALTVPGLMGRLKGRERARAIITLYRDNGDNRPPSRMGFEMVRALPDGTEETEVVIVQDLLDAAAELTPWEPHCAGCPANQTGLPFGCVGAINYPISAQAERWLLDQVPGSAHPLVFVLLQKAIHDLDYTGATVAPLRAQAGVFFESAELPVREIDGFVLSGDQVFEMLFLSGPLGPAQGSLLLQFFGGLPPNLDADVMMRLAQPPSLAWIDEHAPFQHHPSAEDDGSIAAFKAFLRTLYGAYRLGVPVLLDI